MNEDEIIVFIPGRIPSLKNSKVMGRFHSKSVIKWLRTFGISSYNSRQKRILFFKKIEKQYDIIEICSPLVGYNKYPIKMGFHFVRWNKGGNWDFNNSNHIITDLLTALDIIPDDNVNYILPFPLEINNSYWSYDKDNPGVIIKILK